MFTKTEFKVRKITIREQLKVSQYDGGIRQINVEECIAKLKHYGSSVRIEALRNLRDAIAINHGIPMKFKELIWKRSSYVYEMDQMVFWNPQREPVKPYVHLWNGCNPEKRK
ncbi:uncharacterized protein LOC142224969 [Haematobia irritans]|uniref:uncharacterized protein LOC142224969 n=1 Tax=Haematobia irritans TaxID=7368 RepID=UPI003F5084E8